MTFKEIDILSISKSTVDESKRRLQTLRSKFGLIETIEQQRYLCTYRSDWLSDEVHYIL